MTYEMRWIEWLDASGTDQSGTWMPLAQVREQKLGTIQSLGFVVHETDELVTIVQSLDDMVNDEQMVDHFLTIPKFAITASYPVYGE